MVEFGRPSRDDEVWLSATDPEGVVKPFSVHLRFRSEYSAKVFVKRAHEALGLANAKDVREEQEAAAERQHEADRRDATQKRTVEAASRPPDVASYRSLAAGLMLAAVVAVTSFVLAMAPNTKPVAQLPADQPRGQSKSLVGSPKNIPMPLPQPRADQSRGELAAADAAPRDLPLPQLSLEPVQSGASVGSTDLPRPRAVFNLTASTHRFDFSVADRENILGSGSVPEFTGQVKFHRLASGQLIAQVEVGFWPTDMTVTGDHKFSATLRTDRYFSRNEVRIASSGLAVEENWGVVGVPEVTATVRGISKPVPARIRLIRDGDSLGLLLTVAMKDFGFADDFLSLSITPHASRPNTLRPPRF